jgi:hypothetical protein
LEFTGGIALIGADDPARELKIAWCEAHPEKCRDVLDPQADAWAAMRDSQIQRANREATLSPELDVNAILRGDVTGFGPAKSLAAKAREMLAQAVS